VTLDTLALVVAVMGLAVAVTAALVGPGWRPGLGAALELWLAAGLLRLSADAGWTALAAAAAFVAFRYLVAPTLLRRRAPGARV
jgi:hypothetical protein